MKRLPLYLSPANTANLKKLKILTRKYAQISFNDLQVKHELIAKLTRFKLLENVRVIELVSNQVDAEAFYLLLKGSKALEKIIILDSSVERFKKRNLVELESMKSIILMESDLKFLNFIGKTKVRELKIHDAEFKDKNEEILEEYLMRTSSLEEIAIRVRQGLIYKCLLNDDNKEYRFKLKKMSVTYNSFGIEDDVDQSFIGILKQHRETLEHLEIDCNLTEDMYECLFSQMKLKSLQIDCRQIPNTQLFYNAILPNKYLRKLVISKELITANQVYGLLRIYSNIEELNIVTWKQDTSNEILITIANNFNRLKILHIPEIPSNPTEIPIQTLQSLHIESVRNAADFELYLTAHTNIKDLTIKWAFDELTDAVTFHLSNLESIAFGPNFNVTQRMFRMMKKNSPKLHTIQLFRFLDQSVQPHFATSLPRVIYFSNDSSSCVFQSEPGMWTNEDKLYHYSSDEMAISENDSYYSDENLNSDEENFEDDYDDELSDDDDMDFENQFDLY